MARHGTTHWDVAAYALGVLDPADAARCEAHLAQCPSCAADLEALLPTTKLLADVDADTLREMAAPSSMDKLLTSVRTERRWHRTRRRLTAAVGTGAAAALAGFALFAGSTWLAPPTDLVVPPAAAGTPSATASPPSGELVSATDPDTGVRAEVSLRETDWGTLVSFALWSVTGPRAECRLVLVHDDGTSEVAGTWRVPAAGYGTAAWPDPLSLSSPTLVERDDLAELRIVAVDPADSSEDLLVAVPL